MKTLSFGEIKLPPPLSPEEEILLLKTFERSETQEILMTRNLRLVVHIAKKFSNTEIEIEELISIGTIGLIKAVNTFLPEKNIKFATYASRCIQNEILMYLRKYKKYKHDISLDAPISIDSDYQELYLKEIVPDQKTNVLFNICEKRELITFLINYILNLPYKEAIIILYQAGGKTQKEIGNILNISQSYISRLTVKIKDKLHKFLENPKPPKKKDFIFSIEDECFCLKFSKNLLDNYQDIYCDIKYKTDSNSNDIIIIFPMDDEAFIEIADLIKKIYN